VDHVSNAERTGLPDGNWHLLPAARVSPLPRRAVAPPGRLTLALIRRAEKIDDDYNVFTTFARLGSIFPAHTLFLSQLLRRGRLPATEKELVIIRVAWRLGAVYEYGHHLHVARKLAIAEAELDAATQDRPADVSGRLAAFLAATDELLADHTLSDDTWALLRGHASDDELLELCMLVGHYMMVSIMLNATGIQLEPRFAAALTARPA
jgi:alkylhydroperoxidase family enzyme